ncbi:hypothetical protein ABZP36_004979 [Zizania latifolia]
MRGGRCGGGGRMLEATDDAEAEEIERVVESAGDKAEEVSPSNAGCAGADGASRSPLDLSTYGVLVAMASRRHRRALPPPRSGREGPCSAEPPPGAAPKAEAAKESVTVTVRFWPLRFGLAPRVSSSDISGCKYSAPPNTDVLSLGIEDDRAAAAICFIDESKGQIGAPTAHGKCAVTSITFHYPRGKLLDIYRQQKMMPSFDDAQCILEEVPSIMLCTPVKPLAFVAPDTDEEVVLKDIRKGQVVSREVANITGTQIDRKKELEVWSEDMVSCPRPQLEDEAQKILEEVEALKKVNDVLSSMHKDAGEAGEMKSIEGEFLLRVDGGATVNNLLMQIQVFISYGKKSSGELLLSYGFVPKEGTNPNDSVELLVSFNKFNKCYEEKVQVLKRNGLKELSDYILEESKRFPLRVTGWPVELMAYAFLVMAVAASNKSLSKPILN